jgi:hypothetical protein
MKQTFLLLTKIAMAATLLLCAVIAPASALPVLPDGDIVFEFNSWEYITNRNPQTDVNGYQLQVGDIVAGAVKLDNITDGSNVLYTPQAEGVEITGIFGGFEVATATPTDLDADTIPDFINYTFDTTNAYLEIYFDDTPDFDEGADRATALANAGNGNALLEMEPGILKALTDTNDSLGPADDKTNVQSWLNLAPYNAAAIDPFDWNNGAAYLWSEEFENPAGSGIFFPFFLTQEIYAPGHTIFEQNASDTDASGDRLWDYYDTDDVRGSLTNVPEPTTMLLFGFGLLGLASVSRKKRIQ